MLADLVVLVHLAFILFVVLGGVLVFRWRWFPWVHLPAAVWGAFVEATGRVCPLTDLENWLRRTGGGSGYDQDFIERYVVPIVYPIGLTRDTQLVLAALVVVVNSAIYLAAWRRWRSPRPAFESPGTRVPGRGLGND